MASLFLVKYSALLLCIEDGVRFNAKSVLLENLPIQLFLSLQFVVVGFLEAYAFTEYVVDLFLLLN